LPLSLFDMRRRSIVKSIIGISVLIILYLAVSYFVRANSTAILAFINQSYFMGALGFLILMIIDVVFLPIAIPFIPASLNIYGIVPTILITTLGWTFGAVIAFFIARRYGMNVVRRFISQQGIEEIQDLMPSKNLFWTIIAFRILLPMDLGSYALGIFTRVKTKEYTLATLLGVIPSSIYLSFIGQFSLLNEAISLVIGVLLVLIGLVIYSEYRRKQQKVLSI
jgi:uncharacterized membrane protein YdjX (TVP38/TMEM64 family)